MAQIRKSNVEYMDHYLNYIRGCSHGCSYCWSRRLQGIPYEKWIKPELRAIDGLDEQLRIWKPKIHRLFLCNSSDAYQPIARKTTREIIQKLIRHDIQFTILTKSHAALNDVDLLKEYPRCCIGFSITTDNDEQRREWEPYSSSIQERLKAVRQFKDAGVKTWISMEPILPDSSPERILLELKDDVDWWIFGRLNYHPVNNTWYREKGKTLIDLAKRHSLKIYVKKELRELISSDPLPTS